MCVWISKRYNLIMMLLLLFQYGDDYIAVVCTFSVLLSTIQELLFGTVGWFTNIY